MKIIKIIVLLFGIQLIFASYGLTQSDLIISELNFIGLEKTQDIALEWEIISKVGEPVNRIIVEEDLQTIRNMPGISKVDCSIDTLEGNLILQFQIEERKTALPLLNFGGIKNNTFFGIGAIDYNFRGLGDLLLVFYQNNDKRHSGQIFYRKPRIKTSQWGYSFSLNKWASIEPLFFPEGTVSYLYDNLGFGATIIYNIENRRQLELGATFFNETYSQNENQVLENPPGPGSLSINKFLSKIIFNKDNLDYQSFHLQGYNLSFNIQNVYNFFDSSFFNSALFQAIYFARPWTKSNIASRVKFAISSNIYSPFAPFVADSQINVRGIGNRIDRGTAQAVINLEWRQTVYEKNNFGSQIIVFSDMGSWRHPGGSLKNLLKRNQLRHFVGIGFRLIYQKVFGATLRVDYGIDLYNPEQRGWVFGLGQYF